MKKTMYCIDNLVNGVTSEFVMVEAESLTELLTILYDNKKYRVMFMFDEFDDIRTYTVTVPEDIPVYIEDPVSVLDIYDDNDELPF